MKIPDTQSPHGLLDLPTYTDPPLLLQEIDAPFHQAGTMPVPVAIGCPGIAQSDRKPTDFDVEKSSGGPSLCFIH